MNCHFSLCDKKLKISLFIYNYSNTTMKEHLDEGIRTKRPRGKDKAKERFARNGKVSSKHLRELERRERDKRKSHTR